MKKFFISFVMALSAICSAGLPVNAYSGNADIIAPCYLYAFQAKSTLVISTKTATCESSLSGSSIVTKIVATQYLEKKSGSSWKTVSGGTWSNSSTSSSLIMSNSKSSLDNGTYRLRTVFTVYSGTSSESIEKTSSEVTI